MVVGAELLPWWFAGAFWVAFVALVVVAARDIRRAGGVRVVVDAIRERLAEPGGTGADEDDDVEIGRDEDRARDDVSDEDG